MARRETGPDARCSAAPRRASRVRAPQAGAIARRAPRDRPAGQRRGVGAEDLRDAADAVAISGTRGGRRLEHDIGQRLRARGNDQQPPERKGRARRHWRRRSAPRRRARARSTRAFERARSGPSPTIVAVTARHSRASSAIASISTSTPLSARNSPMNTRSVARERARRRRTRLRRRRCARRAPAPAGSPILARTRRAP